MLKHYFYCYCFFEQDDWALYLLITEFIYNNVKHSSTNMSSFEVLCIYSSDLCLNIENNISEKKNTNCVKMSWKNAQNLRASKEEFDKNN